MLSTSSFNALLKTLEEPPPHVKFVLATTDPERIPVTILSRCLQFNLRRLLPAQIHAQLVRIVSDEGVEADDEALARLARCGDGSMRDGLSLLDQAIAFGAGRVTAQDVDRMLGLVDHRHIVSLIAALASNQGSDVLEIVAELVSRSRDLDAVLVSLAETLHRVCLLQTVPEYRDDERPDWDALENLAGRISVADAQLWYQIAVKGREELAIAPDPRTGLEMALLRMLAFRPADAVENDAGSGAPGDTKSSGGTGATERAGTVGSSRQVADGGGPVRAPAGEAPRAVSRGIREPDDDHDWIALAGRLELSGPTRELARNLHLQSRQDDRWEFVIAPSLRHLGSATCVDRLSQALSEEMGHPVQVRLVDSGERPLRTAASLEEQRLRTKMTDAERSIERDPTVRALKREMGAHVVGDSIQPLQ